MSEFTTSEAYFHEADLFFAYIRDEVNPARERFGLAPVPLAVVPRLFQIMHEKTYLPESK